jgi:hypothetical protein
MFTTLNLRWLIDLNERETRGQERINNVHLPWLRTLMQWCKQLV